MRGKNEGSIRQRPDGRWEARYTAVRDPKTGKQIQKSVYGKTRKEVKEKLSPILAALDAGTYIPPSGLTLAAWLSEWPWNVKKTTLKPENVRLVRRILEGAYRGL